MIGFVGLSHLGIVSSAAAAAKGHEIVGVDPDAALCDALNHGLFPVAEPGLDELFATSRSRIHFTADSASLQQCEVIFLSADVPTDQSNRSDLATIDRLVEQVAAAAAPGAVLVVLSQVPPGFMRGVNARLQQLRAGRTFSLFYQVETLIFGRAVERALAPERFIVGCQDPGAELPAPYADVLASFQCPILAMRYESAELAKLAINVFLVSSVSTTNMLAEMCEAVGAEWAEIAPALRLDRRIGPHAYLSPGLGIAGGNLERDLVTLQTLAADAGADAAVVDAWLSHSRYRRDWPLKVLHATAIASRADPVIAVWGLAYKPNTASTKNSPALTLIEALRAFSVRAYDPLVSAGGNLFAHVTRAESAVEACRGSDALTVMTPWPEFSSIELARVRDLMRGRVIVDPFGALDGQRCTDLGFAYYRLGSPGGTTAPAC